MLLKNLLKTMKLNVTVHYIMSIISKLQHQITET